MKCHSNVPVTAIFHLDTLWGVWQPLTGHDIICVDINISITSIPPYKNANSKSCALDPISTSMLKQCLDCLLLILVKIVNLSLSSCTIIKLAIVILILKKILLDLKNKKYFRPVLNLLYLGNLIERTSVHSLSGHIKSNGQDEILQSAYKECHGVEMTLIKFYEDLLCLIDNKPVSIS